MLYRFTVLAVPFHRGKLNFTCTVSPWKTFCWTGFSTDGILKKTMESAKQILAKSPRLKRALKEALPLTPSQQKFVAAAAGIRLDPDQAEKAFMARQLVQCTLPHSNPGSDRPAWTRQSGNLLLTLQPAWDGRKDASVGFPYGTIPRLLLFWITTEAVRTKNRRIELGNSLSQFMRDVGLDPSTGGGKRSDAKRLREQMERLFRCHISFERVGEDSAGRQSKEWLDMQVGPKAQYWWDPKQPEQTTLWGSWVELGEEFYEAITSAPVPVDMRALRALRRSPLALDLYSWATYRVFQVNRKRSAQFISWAQLKLQMGAEYKSVDEFARKAKAAFRKIRGVYPGLKLDYAKGGLMLCPSLTAIPSRPATPAPTSRQGKTGEPS
jgi:Plasmid encoded RepA protein